jgi:elongation factor P--(R)-beta-lysine ligase
MSAGFSLEKRSQALRKIRSFFYDKGLLEVDPYILSEKASIDAHIDLLHTSSPKVKKRFLFSSPEYPMKRLLSKYGQDCFFLGHVFRDEEVGRIHSPEFLMAEWYRLGFSFEQMIEETLSFIELFVENRKRTYLPYKEAFLKGAGLHPFQAKEEELRSFLSSFPELSKEVLQTSSKDDLLNFILSFQVEKSFPKDHLTILYHYPASQASLSQKKDDDEGNKVAERFEIYTEGVELANGYHELNNAEEQRSRLYEENEKRALLGKEQYPLDERFLEALKHMPDASGVAVGVDRLFMIQEKASSIHEIVPIPWEVS